MSKQKQKVNSQNKKKRFIVLQRIINRLRQLIADDAKSLSQSKFKAEENLRQLVQNLNTSLWSMHENGFKSGVTLILGDLERESCQSKYQWFPQSVESNGLTFEIGNNPITLVRMCVNCTLTLPKVYYERVVVQQILKNSNYKNNAEGKFFSVELGDFGDEKMTLKFPLKYFSETKVRHFLCKNNQNDLFAGQKIYI